MPSTLFADISNFTDHFDPITYRASGHVLIAMKASEGVNFADPKHRGFALAAGSRHIQVIHYHFGRPDLNPRGADEADWFIHVTNGLLGPHDYVVYDGERARTGGFGISADHCRSFCDRIAERTRFRAFPYASRSVLAQHDDLVPVGPKRAWDADYSSDAPFAPHGYEPVAKQYTDGVFGPGPHDFAGIGQCDGNIMLGSLRRQVFANAAR